MTFRITLLACVLFLTVLTGPVSSTPSSAAGIQFMISVDKGVYVSGEPVIVKSWVVNKSDQPVQLKRPVAAAFVVTYTLQKLVGEERETLGGPTVGGDPLWTAPADELQPGTMSMSSSELSRPFGDLYLEPGSYALRASYHLSEYGARDYLSNVITSAEIFFDVDPLPENEKQVRRNLTESYYSAEAKQRAGILRSFLAKHPTAIHRVYALNKLLEATHQQKDWQGVIEASRKLQEENISVEYKNLLLYGEGSALRNLNDIPGAISVLQKSFFPQAQALKKQLETKR
jgi:hypothetical protein